MKANLVTIYKHIHGRKIGELYIISLQFYFYETLQIVDL